MTETRRKKKMRSTLKKQSSWLLAVVVVAGLLALLGPGVTGDQVTQADSPTTDVTSWTVDAKNENPGVLPPNSKPHGKTYGEWGAEWWIWATEQPSENNQLLDPDGSFCTVDQSGSVWFLAGAFTDPEGGPVVVERNCSIPAGKSLFFPIANGLSFAPEFGETEEEIRADVANDLVGIYDLKASVDGVELQDLDSYRAASPGFVLPVPEGGLLNEFGLDAGDRDPAVSDGWWIMLTPLPKGEHEIRFSFRSVFAEPDDPDLDVTYHLIVGPQK
jgi:hypothetical protein